MMCRFVACAWGEQTPQLRPLTGQRGCVGEQEGERLRDSERRRESLRKMLLKSPCRVTRVTSCLCSLYSWLEIERRGGGRSVCVICCSVRSGTDDSTISQIFGNMIIALIRCFVLSDQGPF